jgi:oligopeptide transport system permease protein
MGKYLVKRLLQGVVSIIIVVGIVMVMIYSLLDRRMIFAQDPVWSKQQANQKTTYMYQKWENYGYLDYIPYGEYLQGLLRSGEITEEVRAEAASIGRTADKDSEIAAKYVEQFTQYYRSQGYTVERLDAVMTGRKLAKGGQQVIFAHKDHPLTHRLWNYLTGLVQVDNIHKVEEDVGERGITFTWHDPVYDDGRLSPAIIGNGTMHKYLFYMDDQFPFFHQNIASIHLGASYTVNTGIDVFTTMTKTQGSYVLSPMTFPSGLQEESADDLHSATYQAGSRENNPVNADRFTDDYTNVETIKRGMSKMGYSFVIGIISVVMAYIMGVPIGILMAQKKDKFVDKLGTIYIVFITAVPSLAYIFLFKAIGTSVFGLPGAFDMESTSKLMYILPIVSLALPTVAGLMKWMRRYMIDQMNSDYVKFARSSGLTEGEIFSKHIMKNASIPIVHGIPGSILGAMVGAIITERIYVVPGAGNLLTEAINKYDNGVIVGVTLFYAVLSVVSIILGDILMTTVDPRISFTTKDR